MWKSGNEQLLLIGTRVNSVQFGYREMRLTGESLTYPGAITPSSVGGDRDSYAATLEARSIVSIIQAPGTENSSLPLMFASTQSSGLWSFRHDSVAGKPVWNREE